MVEDAPTCAICLTLLNRLALRGSLPCHHSCFCFECIHRWARVNTKCPMCGLRFREVRELLGIHPTGLTLQLQDQLPVPEDNSELRAIERITCSRCGSGERWASMLLCDRCNRGTHLACMGMRRLPEAQLWYCDACLMETDLQTQVAQWAEMRELGRQSPDFLVQLNVGRRAAQVSVVLKSR